MYTGSIHEEVHTILVGVIHMMEHTSLTDLSGLI
jgi:hypothetical protein